MHMGVFVHACVNACALEAVGVRPLQLELDKVMSPYCGGWEPNLGPLQKQYKLLKTLSPAP